MADIKLAYSTTNTPITITLANLGNAAARSSASISNATNLFIDASIGGYIGTGTTTGTNNTIDIYGYSSLDSVNFSAWTSGTDSTVITTPSNLSLLAIISTGQFPTVTSTNYPVQIGSVAAAFGGNLPKYWGVIIDNRSGANLVNTAANHSLSYSGVYSTSS